VCIQVSVVLDLVKVQPSSFLVTSTPVTLRVLEAPPETSIGRFPPKMEGQSETGQASSAGIRSR